MLGRTKGSSETHSWSLCAVGDTLYIYGSGDGQGIKAYDTKNGSVRTVTDRGVKSAGTASGKLFFNDDRGFFMLDGPEGTEECLMTFEEKADRVGTVNDIPLIETRISEGCNVIGIQNDVIWLYYRAERDLSPDEHSIIGSECWAAVCRYDISTKNTETIKSDHWLVDISGSDEFKNDKGLYVRSQYNVPYEWHLFNGALYFITDGVVGRLDPATGDETIIYISEGSIPCIYWDGDTGYLLEHTGKGVSKTYYYLTMKLDDGNVSRVQVDKELADMGILCCYGAEERQFYRFMNRSILAFSWDRPEEYSEIYHFEDMKKEYDITCIQKIGDTLFYACNKAIANAEGSAYVGMIKNGRDEVILQGKDR